MTVTVSVLSPDGSPARRVDIIKYLSHLEDGSPGDFPPVSTAPGEYVLNNVTDKVLGEFLQFAFRSVSNDLTYSGGATGFPTGGTITSLDILSGPKDNLGHIIAPVIRFQFTGLDIDAADFYNAVNSGNINLAVGLFYNQDDFNYTGDVGADSFTAGNKDDTLDGGFGNDNLFGEGGDDTFIGGQGADKIDGGTEGPNGDTVDYSNILSTPHFVKIALGAANVNAANTSAKGSDAIGDLIKNIENITGGAGNDVLTGSFAKNIFKGGDGNDTLSGGANDDTLLGEAGDDLLEGGAGADVLDGGSNTAAGDTLSYTKSTAAGGVSINLGANLAANAGALASEAAGDNIGGFENVTGSNKDDILIAGAGINKILGGLGADIIEGGAGTDILDGGAATENNTLSYASDTAGVDVVLMGAVNATIGTGGVGNHATGDQAKNFLNIIGGSGVDKLTGDAKNNVIEGGADADKLDGLANTTLGDTLSYLASTSFVSVTLNDGPNIASVSGGDAAGDEAKNFENILGSAQNDVLGGNKAANILQGGDGDDTLSGGLGADKLIGGAGTDTADYSASLAAVTINLTKQGTFVPATGAVTGAVAQTGVGSDAAGDLLSGIENLKGSVSNDVFIANSAANKLDGSGGKDTVSYVASLAGLSASLANSAANSGDATGDIYVDVENLTGSAKSDTLIGDDNANTLDGGAGNDQIYSGLGADQLIGGTHLTGVDPGDTANYGLSDAAVTVNLSQQGTGFNAATGLITGPAATFKAQQGGHADGDKLFGIENVSGSTLNDVLTGSTAANILNGGDGNDTLSGGAGIDQLIGGLGDDLLIGGAGADKIQGGNNLDIDTVSYSGSTTAVTIVLADNDGLGAVASGGDAAGDKITGVENVIGGSGADKITGNHLDNVITGGKGNDTLNGGTGADTFVYVGADGLDTINLFEDGVDLIDVAAFAGIEDIGDIVIQDAGADALIVLNSTTKITFKNVDHNLIAGADFKFSNVAPTDITLVGGSAINENESTGTFIATLMAVDADDSSGFTFTLLDGNDNFEIKNGDQLFSVKSLDAEEAASIQIVVQVADAKGGKYQENVDIAVLDDDEFAPVITTGGGDPVTVDLNEGSTALMTVTATDADISPIRYDVVGGADAIRFEINSSSGELSLFPARNAENPMDSNGDNIYHVVVQASGPDFTYSDEIEITVNLNDVDEFASIITSDGGGTSASIYINENTTAVTTVTATDADITPAKYFITGGADVALFKIDASSGELSFVIAPDVEDPQDAGADNNYEVIVEATSGVNSDTQTINVKVFDYDEFAPVITTAGGDPVTVDLNEGSTALMTVTATDADVSPIRYDVVGGADAIRFEINSSSGELSLFPARNAENPMDSNGDNIYHVVVQASGPDFTYSDEIEITVNLKDVDEFASIITSNGSGTSASVSIDENTTAVTTVTATDADITPIKYFITGGSDIALFEIDENTGELSFIAAPDFETPGDSDLDNSYEVEVQARSGTGSLTDSQTITINVNDLSEVPNFAPEIYAPSIERLSETVGGVGGNGQSDAGFAPFSPFSANGEYIVFYSAASNVAAGDTNGKGDFFVRDLETGDLSRIDTGNKGAFSAAASISEDGRYVTFLSASTNLIANDNNNVSDIIIYDRDTETYEGLTGVFGVMNAAAEHVVISGDGRYVAFDAQSTNIADNAKGTFIFDRQSNTVERVLSIGSIPSAFSEDGRYLSFGGTDAGPGKGFVLGDSGGTQDAFVLDTDTDVIERVSNAVGGVAPSHGTGIPSMSADGRYFVFASISTNMVGTHPDALSDIFVYDRQTGTTEIVSVDSDGNQLGIRSTDPSISADGRFVTWYVGDSGSPFDYDVVLHDRLTGTTETISVAPDGMDSSGYHGLVSPDGKYVLFDGYAPNLVPNDDANFQDVYLWRIDQSAAVNRSVADTQTASSLETEGTLRFSDLDAADAHTVLVTKGAGALGTLSAEIKADTAGTGDGGVISWNYELDRAQIAYLEDGEILVEKFTITLSDDHTSDSQLIEITITGVNDEPIFDLLNSVKVADAAAAFDLDIGMIEDVDSDPVITVTATSDGGSIMNGATKVSVGATLTAIELANLTFNPADGAGNFSSSFSFDIDDGAFHASHSVAFNVLDSQAIRDGKSFGTAAVSIKEILDSGLSAGNGLYYIDPDGPGGDAAFEAVGNMTSFSGGWTLAAQSDPGDALVDLTSNQFDLSSGSPSFGGSYRLDLETELVSDANDAVWIHVVGPGSTDIVTSYDAAALSLAANYAGTGNLVQLFVREDATPGYAWPHVGQSISGTAGDDLLIGGNANDNLAGGAGTDVLVGNAGIDMFVFADGSDTDTIMDFVALTDTVDLTGVFSVFTTNQLFGMTQEVGNDIVFDFGNGDVLTFANQTKANIFNAISHGDFYV